MTETNKIITVLGPTATGKTSFAAHLALKIDAEIISADSRQIYRGMDIGTGKDLEDYTIEKVKIPYHLIDIHDAGYEYNLYEYKNDFIKVYKDIQARKKKVILAGGSGLYLEAVLADYELYNAPINKELREQLKDKELEELITILKNTEIKLHNSTDLTSKKRVIRAIEIAKTENKEQFRNDLELKPLIFGINFERKIVKKRITERLNARLKEGMIAEVEKLHESGLSFEKLKYYGLEYKFIAQYLNKEINYNDMKQKLNSAIHQFSKRQMTWYRRMEKNGFKIHWLEGLKSMNEKLEEALKIIEAQGF